MWDTTPVSLPQKGPNKKGHLSRDWTDSLTQDGGDENEKEEEEEVGGG